LSNFEDAEQILNLYSRQTEGEISELSRTIVALRSKVTILSDQLEEERDRIRNLPVPPTVISQIANLNSDKARLIAQVKEKGNELLDYKKLVVAEIKKLKEQKTNIPPVLMAEIANYKTEIYKLTAAIAQYEKVPVSPKLMGEIADMKTLIAEQNSELAYYKQHAQQAVIINKEKVQPSRSGGLGRTTKPQ